MSKPRKTPATLNIEQFTYLPEDSLPCLVLGIHYSPSDFRSDLGGPRAHRFVGNDRSWLKIAHQTAGVGCHQHYWEGLILPPTLVAKEGMRRLEKRYYESNEGIFGVSLDSLVEYRDNLKAWMGADCNGSYSLFEEGLMPIDIGDAKRLTTDKTIPWANLDELIEWESGFERMVGCINRWSVACIFGNSD